MIPHIPKNLYLKYAERIIGYIRYNEEKYFLVTKGSKTSAANPVSDTMFIHLAEITLRCEKCRKILNHVPMPKHLFLIDRMGIYVSIDKIDPHKIFSLEYCQKCEHKLLNNVGAPVVCKACREIVSWLPAQETADGFTVEAGKKYHVEKCNKCDPEMKNVLIEYKKWKKNASSV